MVPVPVRTPSRPAPPSSRRPSRLKRATALVSTALMAVGLATALPVTQAAAAEVPLLAHYNFADVTGTTVPDSSGNGRNAEILGTGATVVNGDLMLPGGAGGSTAGHVRLPAGLFDGQNTLTISSWLKNETGSGNQAAISFGTTQTPYPASYWLLNPANPSGRLKSVMTGSVSAGSPWGTERGISPTTAANGVTGPVTNAEWALYTTVITPTSITSYLNGAKSGPVTMPVSVSSYGTGLVGYLGRSGYNDRFFKGGFRDLKISAEAWTDAQVQAEFVAGLAPAVNALSLGDTSAVIANLTLPGSVLGLPVTWTSSDAAVVSTTGVVTRVETGNRTATLTASVTGGGQTLTKTFEVTVLKALSAQEKADAAAAALVVPNIGDARGNLTLPTTGADGATVAWTTSNGDIVTATGEVARPAAGQPTVTATLTAAVTVGAATATRQFTASVPALPAAEPTTAYMFAYFTGEQAGGEKIFFGASKGNDALHWNDLNDGEAVLESTFGEKGLRDPFIMRSPEGDKFYLIATDLQIAGGNNFGNAQQAGSKYLEVWESTDLVNWGEQRHVKVSSDFAGNTWAPEAFYDAEAGHYVVYWASNIYPTTTVAGRDYRTTYNRMMMATTRDFHTFTPAEPWVDVKRGTGLGTIDVTMLQDGDTYHRILKDENNMTIRQEKSTDLYAKVSGTLPTATSTPGWQLVKAAVGAGQPNQWGGTFNQGEGPMMFKANDGDTTTGGQDTWYMFVDQPSYHGGQGYVPFKTNDLDSGVWTSVAADSDLPTSPRHGTVLPISQSEYADLLTKYQPELLATGIDPVAVRTEVGVAPVLPTQVTVQGGNGTSTQENVTWPTVDPAKYAAVGTFTVDSDVVGASGLRAVATVTVIDSGALDQGLLLHYKLDETSGTTAVDSSGNGRNGVVEGTPNWVAGQGFTFSGGANGTGSAIKMPNNLVAGKDDITVDFDIWVDSTLTGNWFAYNIGNSSVYPNGTGYSFVSGANNQLRATIAEGNYATEQRVQAPGQMAKGAWKHYTYVIDGGTVAAPGSAKLYENGVLVASGAITSSPSKIGEPDGTTTRNYLGRSSYTNDNSFKGKLRDFRVYERTLTEAEAKLLAEDTVTEGLDAALAALTLGDTSALTGNLTLPGSVAGLPVSWATSDPAVITTTGLVTRQQTADGTATLTATISDGGATRTKTFAVTVLRQQTPQQRADAAAAALVVNNIDDVRGHLTLPATGIDGATVTWATGNAAVVAATGLVTRPAAGQPAATVELTATVTVAGATATRVFSAKVPALPAPAAYEGYFFSYFVNNSVAGEKIYFAASNGNNALDWDELNAGQAALESKFGEMGLRDPFLIRSPEGDKFYLIATDLSIGRNGDWDRAQRSGSRYLEIWESTDLINWSEQRHVEVSPPNAGNTWAPEAYWDEANQQFVVFWASKLYSTPNNTGNTYNRMMMATTRDFHTFTPATVWQDRGDSRIDTTVIKEGNTYYRFTKDEGAGTTGCSDIIQEKSTSLTAVDTPGNFAWQFQQGCIGRSAGTSAVEGPSIFKKNPGDPTPNNYYLFVDEYGGRGYIPLGTNDLDNPTWRVPATYDLPASPRHGTVIPVTAAELAAVREAGLEQAPPAPKATAEGLILHYPLNETSGAVANDATGNGYNGAVNGGTTWADGALTLGGTNGYVKLPDNIMSRLEDITVSSEVYVDADQQTPYFIWGLGNTTGGAGDGYLFATGNNTFRAALATGNWTTEQGVASGSPLVRAGWHTLTYTLADGVAILYLDGREVARNGGVTATPGAIGGGKTTANYLGRSNYDGDRYLKGKVRDFRLYNRGLTPAEVLGLGSNALTITDVQSPALKVPAIINAGTGAIVLPVKPGTDLATLAPTYVVGPNSVVTTSGTNYSTPVTVTVTAGGKSRQWTVRAEIMGSPSLPGLNADPNIIVFGDTYYIYATSDGFPGWGGKTFYVWKSKDLVNWEKSAQPILTLDGANGNVPWASGNAWAPTIIERGGKYYFYFSGHNIALNRKTIGVAVADSPEGPFTAQPQAMILNNEAVTSGQAIDPHAFKDPVSGKHYLFWGNGSPVYAELADDMVSLKPGTIKAQTGLTGYREGSFMTYRNGQYHLTYSIDDTGSPNYRVGYATSSSIDGPWTYRGVVLQKDESLGILGTGHHSIVNVPGTDEWYIAYHRFAIPNGGGTNRETTIDKLEWNADGTIKTVVPTLRGIDPLVTAPALTVTAEVESRCLAGIATVVVRVVNTNGVPVTVQLTSPYGTKSFPAVAPGKAALQNWATRLKSIPAGQVTVVATATVDGKPVSVTLNQAYPARSC